MDVMYRSKPFFTLDDSDITVPDTMYSVQPLLTPALHSNSGPVGSREQQLEKRQLSILDQLKQLQSKLATLTGTAGKAGKHGQAQPDSSAANSCPAAVDAVVTTPIAQPALITAMVTSILANSGKAVTTRRYWHSTAGDVPVGFRTGETTEQGQADLRVNFVFKDSPQASLRVSAATHAAIVGDSNAARFLCRSNKYCCYIYSTAGSSRVMGLLSSEMARLQQLYPSNDLLKAAQVDESIDATCNLANATSKDLKSALKGANMTLGGSSYLVGNDMTLADITLWAGLRNAGNPSLPSNVKAWFKKMEASPEAKRAVAILSV